MSKLEVVQYEFQPSRKGKFRIRPNGESWSMEVGETEGFYQLIKSGRRWFLVELDGKLVLMTEFKPLTKDEVHWKSMCVIPYTEELSELKKMLPTASELIERYMI